MRNSQELLITNYSALNTDFFCSFITCLYLALILISKNMGPIYSVGILQSC